MSSASVQPGVGNDEHPGVARPEALQHGEERRAPGVAEPLERRAARLVLAPYGHDVLVLDEAAAPVDRGSSRRRQSSGWKNGGDRLDAPALLPGALRNHTSLNAADREAVEQPVGHPRGGERACAARTRRAWRAAAGRQLVERGVVAAEEDRAAEGRAAVPGSRSRRPSSGSGVAGAHARHARRRGPWLARCRPSMSEVSTGRSRSVASDDDPVRPMPPAVAQNSSGSSVGPDQMHALAAVCSGQRLDVVGEGAVDVVVLAVDVGRDRAADGHEAGARR